MSASSDSGSGYGSSNRSHSSSPAGYVYYYHNAKSKNHILYLILPKTTAINEVTEVFIKNCMRSQYENCMSHKI